VCFTTIPSIQLPLAKHGTTCSSLLDLSVLPVAALQPSLLLPWDYLTIRPVLAQLTPLLHVLGATSVHQRVSPSSFRTPIVGSRGSYVQANLSGFAFRQTVPDWPTTDPCEPLAVGVPFLFDRMLTQLVFCDFGLSPATGFHPSPFFILVAAHGSSPIAAWPPGRSSHERQSIRSQLSPGNRAWTGKQ
jgi:hypothetical protein